MHINQCKRNKFCVILILGAFFTSYGWMWSLLQHFYYYVTLFPEACIAVDKYHYILFEFESSKRDPLAKHRKYRMGRKQILRQRWAHISFHGYFFPAISHNVVQKYKSCPDWNQLTAFVALAVNRIIKYLLLFKELDEKENMVYTLLFKS